MTLVQGFVTAVIAAGVTLVVVAVAGVALVVCSMEDRRGTGCRGGGCRRRPAGDGSTPGRAADGTATGFSSREG